MAWCSVKTKLYLYQTNVPIEVIIVIFMDKITKVQKRNTDKAEAFQQHLYWCPVMSCGASDLIPFARHHLISSLKITSE
jgi:hypothetical protein